MHEQPILQIRESIHLATQQEAKTHELQNYLRNSLPRLHKAIDLPGDDPSSALLRFVEQYIRQVPDMLEALTGAMQDTGTYASCKVFLNIAEDFFLKPPEIVQSHTGLQALIDEAYLSHRLMEELNDRLMLVSGAPLIPIDMTLPNIVVHDLLGEEYANQLDLAVHYAIEALFQQDLIDRDQLKLLTQGENTKKWQALVEQWPDLELHNNVHLHFDSNAKPGPVH